ncbi:MAG: alpha/beta fold hydrolase [Chloroflexi bacterium]|nr:alpha/beta fold hydrolase [Chloroflexota bacterium]
MEPKIQYAKTSDGVNIAYWTLGEGMPLVYMPHPPISHIQMEWQLPERRAWYERLARTRQLIRYDGRGSGLSDRDVAEYTLDTLIIDLEAVVGRLGIEKFALLGPHHAGPVAIAYTARHPERVSHLLLWCAYARGSDYSPPKQIQAARTLIDKDWETYTETVAHAALGWSSGEMARWFAALRREGTTPELAQLAYDTFRDFDVSDLLSEIRRPTLVLHVRRYGNVSFEVAKGLASRIPNAHLALLEGTLGVPYLESTEAVAQAIDDFLGDDRAAEPAAAAVATEDTHTILFTDVEGSTALTDRLGDAKARELLREHERMVREALKAHGGSEVKTMGDGFMASFGSATKALKCAIAIQSVFAERNESAEEPIKVRIGLNAGEPIAEDDPGGHSDLYGTAVNMAARIAAKAEGGQILVPVVVRELVAGKEFLFADCGDTELRGFEDPVRVYEVRWRE